jgi:hypothetical protein
LRQQNHPDRQRKKTVTQTRKHAPYPQKRPILTNSSPARRIAPGSDGLFQLRSERDFHFFSNEYEIFLLKDSIWNVLDAPTFWSFASFFEALIC